jgi:hypothetical protein
VAFVWRGAVWTMYVTVPVACREILFLRLRVTKSEETCGLRKIFAQSGS